MFVRIKKYNEPKNIIGRKSKTGMSIASGDIYTKVTSRINSFTLDNTVNNKSYIKMAVSFDNGATWKTYKDNSFSDLNITIANKTYEDMTVDEKNNWESAKETILSEYRCLGVIDNNEGAPPPAARLKKYRIYYLLQLVEKALFRVVM